MAATFFALRMRINFMYPETVFRGVSETQFRTTWPAQSVETSKITGYTLNGNGGKYRDYAPEDVQYTTRQRTRMTPQMQLV